VTTFVAVITALAMQEMAEKNKWLVAKWPLILWSGMLALVLLAAVYAGTVGILLARRGKSTQRALVSAFWFPVTFGLPVTLLCVCEYGLVKHQGHEAKAPAMMWLGLFTGYFGVIYFLVGQSIGWLVAAIYGWFCRRGKKKVEAVTTV
jgi:hypothetical protein